MGKGERPEHMAPPEVFYNDDEARKYTTNSRIIAIQEKLTTRALELLALPDDGTPRLLLDLGCGSGLSGEAISEAGHVWVGLDISPSMLEVALDKEVEGDLALSDLGQGVPFRRGACFDGALSISALQWLCNADKVGHEPRRRLKRFFDSLYGCLARGARAVLQVYPENAAQAEIMVSAAMKAGFSGGLVVDFPHSTRAKKFYLCLMVGSSYVAPRARGLEGEEDSDDERGGRQSVKVMGRERRRGGSKPGDKGGSGVSKDRQWVLKKKEQRRQRGLAGVAEDTKYTARKRKRVI